MRWAGRNFDAGRDHHAWVVWAVTVLVLALLVALVTARSATTACCWPAAWNRVVLYLTLGFRQFSHYFTDIRDAFERGDETRRAPCSRSGAISMPASCRAPSCCAT